MQAKNNGRLYVFEGPDSVGKTSLCLLLAKKLRELEIDCEVLAFPGRESGTIGNLVYELHHDHAKLNVQKLSPLVRQMLHVAAHVDVIESRVLPALNSGRTVILDRFWWSTLVYGLVDGLDVDLLHSILAPETKLWGGVQPQILFLISRPAPIEFPISSDWSKCAQLYMEFAATQSEKQRVSHISNEQSFDVALECVLQKISEIERGTFANQNTTQGIHSDLQSVRWSEKHCNPKEGNR